MFKLRAPRYLVHETNISLDLCVERVDSMLKIRNPHNVGIGSWSSEGLMNQNEMESAQTSP